MTFGGAQRLGSGRNVGIFVIQGACKAAPIHGRAQRLSSILRMHVNLMSLTEVSVTPTSTRHPVPIRTVRVLRMLEPGAHL